jgi:hypothetical protein
MSKENEKHIKLFNEHQENLNISDVIPPFKLFKHKDGRIYDCSTTQIEAIVDKDGKLIFYVYYYSEYTIVTPINEV